VGGDRRITGAALPMASMPRRASAVMTGLWVAAVADEGDGLLTHHRGSAGLVAARWCRLAGAFEVESMHSPGDGRGHAVRSGQGEQHLLVTSPPRL
jgi:hypothetical protein